MFSRLSCDNMPQLVRPDAAGLARRHPPTLLPVPPAQGGSGGAEDAQCYSQVEQG
jgi:hypothetical protein